MQWDTHHPPRAAAQQQGRRPFPTSQGKSPHSLLLAQNSPLAHPLSDLLLHFLPFYFDCDCPAAPHSVPPPQHLVCFFFLLEFARAAGTSGWAVCASVVGCAETLPTSFVFELGGRRECDI